LTRPGNRRGLAGPIPENVPRFLEMPLVVSVTVTFVNLTIIGGLHGGKHVAVSVSENSALLFCTGKSRSMETDSLLTALG
jgi:hypothetical protein